MKTIILALACAALLATGCAGGRQNLRETGGIKVDVHCMEAVHIEDVSVYEAESGLEVAGVVRRSHPSAPSRGTVEIKVTDAAGRVVTADQTEYSIGRTARPPKKSIIARAGREEGRFGKFIKLDNPKGSTVALSLAGGAVASRP